MNVQTRGSSIQVAPLAGYPALRMVGTTAPAALNDPEEQSRALLRLAERINSDAIMTLMDVSVEAEGLGAAVRYSDTESPSVTGHLLDVTVHGFFG